MLWLLGLLATVTIVAAVDALTVGWDQSGVPVSAGGITFGGHIYLFGIAHGYAGTRALDCRSWSPLTGAKAVVIALAIGSVVITAWTALRDRTIATLPPLAFFSAVVVIVLPFAVAAIRRRNPVRFPAHAAHLRRLTRGPLAPPPA